MCQQRHATRERELVAVGIQSEEGEICGHRGQKRPAGRVHEGEVLSLFVQVVQEEDVLVHDVLVEQKPGQFPVLDAQFSNLLSLRSYRHSFRILGFGR